MTVFLVDNLNSMNWLSVVLEKQRLFCEAGIVCLDLRFKRVEAYIRLMCVCPCHRCICVEKKNQLDATEWFIALIICSACFGYFYSHHQECETICVLFPPMVCDVVVVGGQVQDSRLYVRDEGCCSNAVEQHPSFRTHSRLSCTWPPTNSNQDIAHHRR